MKKFLFALMGLFASVAFNSVAGAAIAGIAGFDPATGAVAANGISVAASAIGNFAPAGVMRVGIFAEVWTGELIKAFRSDDESVGWYNRIRNYDQYVNKDVIHFVDLGGDPIILVNNNTYPLEIEDLPDGDKAVTLDKFQSKPTRITDDELHAISYDKMSVVIEKHTEAFKEKKYSRAIHALAPSENTAKTPVVLTRLNLSSLSVLEMNFIIPSSTALVLFTTQNAPPMTRTKAMIPACWLKPSYKAENTCHV